MRNRDIQADIVTFFNLLDESDDNELSEDVLAFLCSREWTKNDITLFKLFSLYEWSKKNYVTLSLGEMDTIFCDFYMINSFCSLYPGSIDWTVCANGSAESIEQVIWFIRQLDEIAESN